MVDAMELGASTEQQRPIDMMRRPEPYRALDSPMSPLLEGCRFANALLMAPSATEQPDAAASGNRRAEAACIAASCTRGSSDA